MNDLLPHFLIQLVKLCRTHGEINSEFSNFNDSLKAIKKLFSEEYLRHKYLLESKLLDQGVKYILKLGVVFDGKRVCVKEGE